jgi:transcription factor 1
MAAPPGDINRCKLTIIAEATAEQNLAVPVEELMPYVDHWHPLPSIGNTSTTKRIDHRKIGAPVVAVNITPLARPASSFLHCVGF